MKNTTTHLQFAELLFKIKDNAGEIQKRLNNGTTITELTKEYGCALHTMRNLLTANHIQFGRNAQPTTQIDNLITVVKRICDRMSIDCSELK